MTPSSFTSKKWLWTPCARSCRAGLFAFIGMVSIESYASVSEFMDSTYLIALKQGSQLSDKAAGAQGVGYESARGDWVSMNQWYSTKWRDVHFSFMTQVDKSFGIVWGFSTGERGEKYAVAPSWKLGFVYAIEPTRGSHFLIKASRTFSGALNEKSCTADYGAIGGVREVNCRLAATPLAPEETLQYRFNDKPFDRTIMSLEFRKEF